MDKTQLIVWIVVVAAAIGKWLFENAGGLQGGGSDETPRSLRPKAESEPRTETEEEKMRRFMEALGLPKGSAPPVARKPTPKPQPASPPRPEIKHVGHPISPSCPRPKIAPPLDTGGPLPSIPKTASVAETAPAMEVASIPKMTFAPQAAVSSAGEAVSAPKLSRSASPPAQQPEPAGGVEVLVEQLRDPASLRRAFILKEILGAPKGLQSAESLSIFSPL